MLIQHNHEPGPFDAGHCWACAREAGLLDHYQRVQREEAALRVAGHWARQARRLAMWALCPAGVGILLARHRPAEGLTRHLGGVMDGTEPPMHYEIVVEGLLDPCWSAWFDGLRLSADASGQTTTIAGPVTDQAALHGLLGKVRDLGLQLIAVRCIEPD
jgi:hypothetical protein